VPVVGEDYYSDTVVHFESGLNGDDVQCFQVTILSDSVVEHTESFNISIAAANQIFDATLPSSAVVSIVDNNGNATHHHNVIFKYSLYHNHHITTHAHTVYMYICLFFCSSGS